MQEPQKNLLSMLLMLLVTVLIFFVMMKNAVPYNFRSTIVKVYGPTGHGSGSVIKSNSKGSVILTNRHVCDGITYTAAEQKKMGKILEGSMVCMFEPQGKACKRIMDAYEKYLTTINSVGRQVHIKFNNLPHADTNGIILRVGKNVDLCLVEIKRGDLPVIQISRTEAVPGDKISSIGNPLYMTNAQTDGYVGDNMTYKGRRYQHHTGVIFGGNSGGPVCSSNRGELVGVNTLGTSQPTASYMIPLSEIVKFLRGE